MDRIVKLVDGILDRDLERGEKRRAIDRAARLYLTLTTLEELERELTADHDPAGDRVADAAYQVRAALTGITGVSLEHPE